MNVKRLVWLAAAAAPLFGCTEQPEPEAPNAQEGPSAPPEKQAARPAERGVDGEADALLRSMSDYLGSLQSFSFSAEHTLEVVLQSGEKRQYAAGSRVSIRRPNKLRSERRGEFADVAASSSPSSSSPPAARAPEQVGEPSERVGNLNRDIHRPPS